MTLEDLLNAEHENAEREKLIDEITSWDDQNWYTREELEDMPTEYLENLLYIRKGNDV